MYRVVFLSVHPRFTKATAQGKLERLLKATPAQIAKLLDSPGHVLRTGVSKEDAERYCVVLGAAGAICKSELLSSPLEVDLPLTGVRSESTAAINHSDEPTNACVAMPSGWEKRFQLLEALNADRLTVSEILRSAEYRKLPRSDRLALFPSWGGILLGPIYYFYRGMHQKGLLMLSLVCLLFAAVLVLEAAFGRPLKWLDVPIGLAIPGICGLYAAHDLFRSIKFGERTWPWLDDALPFRFRTLAVSTVSALVLLATLFLTPWYVHRTDAERIADIRGVWRSDTDGHLIAIRLGGPDRAWTLGEKRYAVLSSELYRQHHTYKVRVQSPDESRPLTWVLRQHFADDDSFTLGVTYHDGKQDTLSFVRE